MRTTVHHKLFCFCVFAMVWPRRAALRRHEMIHGEKQPCYTATSGPMRHYISQTKSHYSGFSPLKSHPDSVIAISNPLSQYLTTIHPKHTYTHTHTHTYTYTHIHLHTHTRIVCWLSDCLTGWVADWHVHSLTHMHTNKQMRARARAHTHTLTYTHHTLSGSQLSRWSSWVWVLKSTETRKSAKPSSHLQFGQEKSGTRRRQYCCLSPDDWRRWRWNMKHPQTFDLKDFRIAQTSTECTIAKSDLTTSLKVIGNSRNTKFHNLVLTHPCIACDGR